LSQLLPGLKGFNRLSGGVKDPGARTAIKGLEDVLDTLLRHLSGVQVSAGITLPIAESDVTGLTADLAGKAAASHTHAESDITGLVADLAGKAATSHTHAESDVTGLVSDLAAKVPTSRTITATSPIRIDGGSSADLSANRTISLDSSLVGGLAFFGDGSDGDVHFDGAATILGIAPSGPANVAYGAQGSAGAGTSYSSMFYNLTRDI